MTREFMASKENAAAAAEAKLKNGKNGVSNGKTNGGNGHANGGRERAGERAAAAVRAPWAGTPRNAACPCGSGKKFKHCHGRI